MQVHGSECEFKCASTYELWTQVVQASVVYLRVQTQGGVSWVSEGMNKRVGVQACVKMAGVRGYA